MAAVAGTTISIWLNALTVNHRDLHQFVPTVIGFMIWLTPVFYPVTLIPSQYSFFLYLNPIAGIIQCFRWSVLGDPFPGFWVLPSFLFILLMVILGLKSFIKSEVDLPDNI
jgi:lipopolysaccharide transport system permease protein